MKPKMLARFGVVCFFLVAPLAAVALAYPAAAAVACPDCFGFELIGDGIYVEAGTDPGRRASVKKIVTEARGLVGTFYGELRSAPTVMVCVSEDCYRRMGGGGSRGMAMLDRALFLSARGTNSVIAAHEFAHIELHHRIGLLATIRRDVPQWFDEGLAVTVSGDTRYLASTSSGDRCLNASDEPLPTQRAAWLETAESRSLYAKAACRVSRWLARHGGAAAAPALADRVGRGEKFEYAYERL